MITRRQTCGQVYTPFFRGSWVRSLSLCARRAVALAMASEAEVRLPDLRKVTFSASTRWTLLASGS